MNNDSSYYGQGSSLYRGDRMEDTSERHHDSFRDRGRGGYRGSRGHANNGRNSSIGDWGDRSDRGGRGGRGGRGRGLGYGQGYGGRDLYREHRDQGNYGDGGSFRGHYRSGPGASMREGRDGRDGREQRERERDPRERDHRDSRERGSRKLDSFRSNREFQEIRNQKHDFPRDTQLQPRNFSDTHKDSKDQSANDSRTTDKEHFPSRENSSIMGFRSAHGNRELLDVSRRGESEHSPLDSNNNRAHYGSQVRNDSTHSSQGSNGLPSVAPPKMKNPWISILQIKDVKVAALMETNYQEEMALNEKLTKLQMESQKLESTLATFDLYSKRDSLYVDMCVRTLEEFTYL